MGFCAELACWQETHSFVQKWPKIVFIVMALKENRPLSAFICESEGCGNSYRSYGTCSLLRPYQPNTEHKPVDLKSRKAGASKDVVRNFFPEDLGERKRLSRVKQSIISLTDEELKKFALPRLTKTVNEWLYLKQCCQFGKDEFSRPQAADVLKHFRELQNQVCLEYPELAPWVFPSSLSSSPASLAKLICEAIVDKDNGKIFKEVLMPAVYHKFRPLFTEFSCDVMSYFGVGQRRSAGYFAEHLWYET